MRIPGDVQVGASDVADQQRVAAEQQPRLLGAAAPVGNRVRMVGRRVTGRRDCGDDRVPEFDDIAVVSATWSNSTPAPEGT